MRRLIIVLLLLFKIWSIFGTGNSTDCNSNAEPTEPECPSRNVTFYYSDFPGQIHGYRYEGHFQKESTNFTFAKSWPEIKSLTYDHAHKEFLFVDKSSSGIIYGLSQAVSPHVVVNDTNINFDSIVVDTVTHNIYYTQYGKGIGVCSGHGEGSKCVLIIDESNNLSEIVYSNLILYPQKGIMFWLQGYSHTQVKLVKMASMDGKHIRTLENLGGSRGLAFNPEIDRLYAAQENSITKFSLNNHSIEHLANFSAKHLFIINCYVYSFENSLFPRLTEVYDDMMHKVRMYYGHKKDFPDFATTLVLDSDKYQQPNPCKKFECNGVCVLSETYPNPQPICITSKPKQQKPLIKWQNNPINGLFVFSTFLFLTLTLILVGARFDFWSAARRWLSHKMGRRVSVEAMTFKNATESDDL